MAIVRELKHQTFFGPQPEVFLQHDSHFRMLRRSWVAVTNFKTRVLRLKPEVQILGSSKSIRHTKVETLRLKSCFLRKKETKLHANLWKTFLNYSVGVRDGFTFVCLMICIWRVNHVTDPVLRRQPCRPWIKNVWCLSSLWWWCPRHVFLLSIHVAGSEQWTWGVIGKEVTSATVLSLVCGLFQALWFSGFHWC